MNRKTNQIRSEIHNNGNGHKDQQSFGVLLKESRQKGNQKFTLKQLSQIIGCPEWYLRRLESNKVAKPKPDVLLRLISFFHWDPNKVAEIFENPRRLKLRAEIAIYESKLQELDVLSAKSLPLNSLEGELAYYGLLRVLAREHGVDK
ncbi:MAG: helix-turn-helix transcriptional regulator [Dehalococcoidia bacterium]